MNGPNEMFSGEVMENLSALLTSGEWERNKLRRIPKIALLDDDSTYRFLFKRYADHRKIPCEVYRSLEELLQVEGFDFDLGLGACGSKFE